MTSWSYDACPVFRWLPGVGSVVSFVSFRDTREKVAFVRGLALEDAPKLAPLARWIVRAQDSYDHVGRLAALHDWRLATIGYDTEIGEMFDAPLNLLRTKVADCEDHACLGASLAASLGYSFALLTMNGTAMDPGHMSLAVAPTKHPPWPVPRWDTVGHYALPKGWYWSETTIAAKFGEHPAKALARLPRHDRPDVAAA